MIKLRLLFACSPFALAAAVGCGSDTPGSSPDGGAGGGAEGGNGGSGGSGATGGAYGGGAGGGPTEGDGSAPGTLPPYFMPTQGGFVLSNGTAAIRYDLATGRFDAGGGDGTYPVHGAFASATLESPASSLSSTTGTHAVTGPNAVSSSFGDGVEVDVTTTPGGSSGPVLVQMFAVYPNHPYALVGARVESPSPISSRHVAPLVVDAMGSVDAKPGSDPRVLDVPYDNDNWVRFDARSLGKNDFGGIGYEVGAVYEATTRNGTVIGSVTHDTWKTGFDYKATAGRLRGLEVYGGAATADSPQSGLPPGGPTYGQDGTHDAPGQPHGPVSGKKVAGPLLFVGMFADVRDGLEEFGRANALVFPAKPWTGGVPFGWNSWAAYGARYAPGSDANYAKDENDALLAAAKFMKTLMAAGFGKGTDVYVNADADGGGDAATIDAIHQMGLKVGTYRTPFVYYGGANTLSNTFKVGSTTYTIGDILLHSEADPVNPIRTKGNYVFDPTHPGAQAMIQSSLAGIAANHFDLVKLDFVTFGALEGKHWDKNVTTGTQAYNVGMKLVNDALPPNVFVSLSIAPLFPHGYGHARRLSCDIFGQLTDLDAPAFPYEGSTEYLLENLTFGGWQSGTLYRFGDPDAMALFKFYGKSQTPGNWTPPRIMASAISGTVFFDATDPYDSNAVSRAISNLGHQEVNDVATIGRAFRPLEVGTAYQSAPVPASGGHPANTNSGSQASDTFVLDQGAQGTLVATFNFDEKSGTTRIIDLGRVGLDSKATYHVRNLWNAADSGTATGTLSVPLQGGEAKLFRLTP